MTDSIKIYTSIEHVLATQVEIQSLPANLKQISNNYGELLSSKPATVWTKSPLTGAEFKVTPVFQNKLATPGELIGYEVSINMPACVVGNNALPQILVYGCCLFALEFLKWHLLKEECSLNIVKQLDLGHTTICEIDITYLLACEHHQEAKTFNAKIKNYGEATLNTKHSNPKQRKPIITYSSAGLTTVTITKPCHFEAKSYVKVGPVPRSYEQFPSRDIEKAIYAESESKVRLEFKADKKWLLRNDAESPFVWKNKNKTAKLCKKAFDDITDYLRVSEKLRSKRPKPDQIVNKLSPAEQRILLDYFDGIDPKKHPGLQSKSPQYFSSVKRKIEKEFRIDITIPWAIHSKQISPDLPDWMQLPVEYEPPAPLLQNCFVRDTAKAKLEQLRQLNATLIQRNMNAVVSQQPSQSVKKRGKEKLRITLANCGSRRN